MTQQDTSSSNRKRNLFVLVALMLVAGLAYGAMMLKIHLYGHGRIDGAPAAATE